MDDELGDLVEAVLDPYRLPPELESSNDPQDPPGWTTQRIGSVASNSASTAPTPQLGDEDDEDPTADEDVPQTGVLAEFLERVSLVADSDDIPDNDAGVVTLMTLHTAKGV